MRSKILLFVAGCMLCCLTACSPEPLAFPDAPSDGRAAIMVNSGLYLLNPEPVPIEVDESAIIGYTTSYTTGTPSMEGETNFSKELNLPYAWVNYSIYVLYEDEWYECQLPAK